MVCQAKSMSGLCGYVGLMRVCWPNEGLSNQWGFVKSMRVTLFYEALSVKWGFVGLVRICQINVGFSAMLYEAMSV